MRRGTDAFARLVWRRPVTDAESDRLWALVSAELDEPEGLRAGVRQAVHALLLSPGFLFRVETGSAPGAPLTGAERAARLAAFLWRSVPDNDLLDAAEAGQLDSDEGMREVAAQLLESPKSARMIGDLGEQWLLQRQTAVADPEYELFPDFDEELREAMLTETRLVFEELWSENRSLLDLVNADFTYVNERLARHYGMAVEGPDFVRVDLRRQSRWHSHARLVVDGHLPADSDLAGQTGKVGS